MGTLLQYAQNENGKLVHIDSVKNGTNCHCICPYCYNKLIAKNGGAKNEHHFAHSHGTTCEGAYETALHLLAKEVLMAEKQIMLPASNNKNFPSGLVSLHNLQQEKWDEKYNIRPDVEGIMPNGERLLIEFYVTHKIQEKKHDIIIQNQLKCVEIDLNWVNCDKHSIRDFLLNKTNYRGWVEEQEIEIKDKESVTFYKTNPIHQQAIEYLKNKFETDTLKIIPDEPSKMYYDLKQYKYDVCEINSKMCRRFNSDLLLFRSTKKDEETSRISICIMSRKRSITNEIPHGLRVIDIIINNQSDLNWLMNQEFLINDKDKVCYRGDWKTNDTKKLKAINLNFEKYRIDNSVNQFTKTKELLSKEHRLDFFSYKRPKWTKQLENFDPSAQQQKWLEQTCPNKHH